MDMYIFFDLLEPQQPRKNVLRLSILEDNGD